MSPSSKKSRKKAPPKRKNDPLLLRKQVPETLLDMRTPLYTLLLWEELEILKEVAPQILTSQQWEAFSRHILEHESVGEIAESMCTTPDNIRQLVARAKSMIHAHYAPVAERICEDKRAEKMRRTIHRIA